MSSARLPILEKFIGDLRTIWAAEAHEQRRMEKAKPLLERLVSDGGLKAHSAAWPSTEGYKNVLLYIDPDHHFVINAVVRAPGRTGGVHDHADAWVLYGVLDGSERLERYERVDDGSRAGYADVRLSSVTTGTQGTVDLVTAACDPCRTGRSHPIRGNHRAQPAARRRHGAATHLRSQGKDRDRALRPDPGAL